MRRICLEVDDAEAKISLTSLVRDAGARQRIVLSSSSTGREKMIDLKSDILSLTSVVTVEAEDADLTEVATPMSLATSLILGGEGGGCKTNPLLIRSDDLVDLSCDETVLQR